MSQYNNIHRESIESTTVQDVVFTLLLKSVFNLQDGLRSPKIVWWIGDGGSASVKWLKGSLPLGDVSFDSSLIAFKSHFLASCCNLSANFTDVALSISNKDLGCGMGGLDCSVFLLSLSLLLLSVLLVVVVLIGGIRGTLMVAVTEFEFGLSIRSELFSRREVTWLAAAAAVVVVDDRGGGEIVKVADIFCSSFSSSSRLAPRKAFRRGELIV